MQTTTDTPTIRVVASHIGGSTDWQEGSSDKLHDVIFNELAYPGSMRSMKGGGGPCMGP